MRFLLAVPVGHQLDWSAAGAFVAGLSDEVLKRVAPECSAILGQRVVLPAIIVRQRLNDALAELCAAMDSALLPNDQDYRERRGSAKWECWSCTRRSAGRSSPTSSS